MMWLILAIAVLVAVSTLIRAAAINRPRQPLGEDVFDRFSPEIAALPLPGRHETFVSEIFAAIFLACLAIVSLLVALIAQDGQSGSLSSVAVTFIASLLGLGLLGTVICIWCQLQTRRFWRRHLADSYTAPYLKVMQGAEIPQWSCSRVACERATNKLRAGFEKAHIQPPSVVVDMEFALPLTSLDPLPGLPEPEVVLSSFRSKLSNTLSLLFLGLVGLMYAILGGGWICLVLGLSFLVIGLAPLPPVRQLVRHFRRDSKGLIAGPGFAVGPSGQIWHVGNSIAIVRMGQLRPAASGAVYLQLLGACGGRRITFSSIKDPDFLCFWLRWTHPEPRPELAASVSADILPK